MKRVKIFPLLCLLVFLSCGRSERKKVPVLPYRVLLLGGTDISDHTFFRDGMAQDLAALMKGWSIPFEIFSLAERKLRHGDLFNNNGGLKFGVILWGVNPDDMGRRFHDDERNLVRRAIALGAGLVDPGGYLLSDITLRKYVGVRSVKKINPFKIRVTRPVVLRTHFITHGYKFLRFKKTMNRLHSKIITVPGSLLLSAGGQPILAANRTTFSRNVLLLPPSEHTYRRQSGFAHLFRRAIIWSCGYGLYKLYPDTVILRMDDPGSSNPFYLDRWAFKILSAREWDQAVSRPLKKYGATMDIFMIPGAVLLNQRTMSPLIKKSWKVSAFTDRYNHYQDPVGLWKKIREDMRARLVHIQSHGWTHMDTNLDEWPIAKDRFSNSKYFKEFYHRTTRNDVDSVTQLLHLRRAREWLGEYFSTRPLVFGPPGDIYSTKTEKGQFTYRLAMKTGYAMGADGNNYFFFSDSTVIQCRMTEAAYLKDDPTGSDFLLPSVALLHDRDLRVHGLNYLEKHIRKIQNKSQKIVHFISMDEFCAGLHTKIINVPGTHLRLQLNPHPEFSEFFSNHSSRWYFTVIPEITKQFTSSPLSFSVDGNHVTAERVIPGTFRITLPPMDNNGISLLIH